MSRILSIRGVMAVGLWLGYLATLGYGQSSDDEQKISSIAGEARDILARYCYRCHNGEGSDSGYAFDVKNVESLVDQGVVSAKKPEDSLLFTDLESGRMPPRNQPHLPRPTPAEASVIKEWIKLGAVAFPEAKRRGDFRSLKQSLTLMRDHLKSLRPAERKDTRYFTLVHLWNNPEVDEAYLKNVRAGVSKVINSLSWEKEIVLPTLVDPDQAIVAIRLSDYGWTLEHWEALVREYPYGLSYGSHPDQELEKLDKEIAKLMETNQLPHLRADWFVSTATKPKLYHQLLYELVIPSLRNRQKEPADAANPKKMTDRDLEEFLGVDIEKNIFGAGPRPIRSGFTQSGISGQNRMIEMHRIDNTRSYWKSYDFLASTREAILSEFPLGPIAARHPKPELAFRHDGGEIIFHLNNGLQGYLLSASSGARLDAGPIEIVGDSLRTSGTQAIVNGLSCIACHRLGMVEPPNDEVRLFASVFGDGKTLVEELYPPQTKINEEIQRSRHVFIEALEKAIAPFLLEQDEDKLSLTHLPEPVSEVSRRFLLESLNLQTVANELNEPDSRFLAESLQKTNVFRTLGLNVLTRENGVIKRDAWESRAAFSLMQEAARELGYSPRR
jgi:serine/threonine-protein kinase